MWHVCARLILSKKRIFLLKTGKNHKKMAIFRCLQLIKTHKSSFKDDLMLVFYQNISKSIQKWLNIKKLPSSFCHPLRLLCTVCHSRKKPFNTFWDKKTVDYSLPNQLCKLNQVRSTKWHQKYSQGTGFSLYNWPIIAPMVLKKDLRNEPQDCSTINYFDNMILTISVLWIYIFLRWHLWINT